MGKIGNIRLKDDGRLGVLDSDTRNVITSAVSCRIIAIIAATGTRLPSGR
jgi:hypothetical protein